MENPKRANWRLAFLEGAFVSIFVLGLFYYWYGLANRHIVFLYEHTAVGIPSAQPFDEMTSSRYWLSGLVASGAVIVLHSVSSWLRGRVAAWRGKRYTPAEWWRVWLSSALPIGIGVLAITMILNDPTLPLGLAVRCVLATLIGLAVAILPGRWAAERPVELIWLAADGVGLMPPLLLLRAIELPGRGLPVSALLAWLFGIGSVVVGAGWLVGMSLLRVWRGREMPGAGRVLLAGLGLSYILMPLVHYLLATPAAYRYISTASNFFAFNVGIQALAVLVAVGLVVGVANGRVWLSNSRSI